MFVFFKNDLPSPRHQLLISNLFCRKKYYISVFNTWGDWQVPVTEWERLSRWGRAGCRAEDGLSGAGRSSPTFVRRGRWRGWQVSLLLGGRTRQCKVLEHVVVDFGRNLLFLRNLFDGFDGVGVTWPTWWRCNESIVEIPRKVSVSLHCTLTYLFSCLWQR